MLSVFLRRIFFWVCAKKKFFLEAFDTICKHQQRFFKIFDVLGTLKIIKKIEFLTRMLQPLCARWAYGSGTDAHPEPARQELIRTLSLRVRNWFAPWAYASVPDAHAQHAHQFSYFLNVHFVYPQHARKELMRALSMRVRNWCVRWA
jgi:hypothetical protein